MKSKIFLFSMLIATPAFGMDYIKNLIGYADDNAARVGTLMLSSHIEDDLEIIETADQTKSRKKQEKLLKEKKPYDNFEEINDVKKIREEQETDDATRTGKLILSSHIEDDLDIIETVDQTKSRKKQEKLLKEKKKLEEKIAEINNELMRQNK